MADPSFEDFPRKGAITIIGSNEWDYESSKSYQWNAKLFTMAVRMKDYRYILVNDGTEELYHNAKDPYEWNNLLFTPDMKTEETQQAKKVAFDVLNSELEGLGYGTLDAESDPKTCASDNWVKC